MLRSAVFLDRDGVINKDFGYVYKISDIEWIEGVIEAIQYFNNNNYLVFVVTNQSGVARKLYTEADVISLHLWMNNYLRKRNALLSEIRYCPHHPNALINRYKKICNCRKPNPGMILSLIKNWNIDKSSSFLIGDKESDIKAAKNAGIGGYMFESSNLNKFVVSIMKKEAISKNL